jgi:flavin reductase (DIM6/NTAB) family NADH-FMN oxidoreductase RutF
VSINPSEFRNVLGHFASGVTVVATRDDTGVNHGMTVSAFSSLSLEPPLIAVCIGHAATIAGAMAAASHFGVSVLGEHQQALSRRFAESDTDRFGGVLTTLGAGGVPLIDGAIGWLACKVHARHEGGDHTIVVGAVLDAGTHAGEPLVYFRGAYRRLGE